MLIIGFKRRALLASFFLILIMAQSVAFAIGKADLWYRTGFDYSQKGNNDKAFSYMLRAADSGHAAAQNNIGLSYLHGLGVEKDENKAFIWFEKAAKKGLKYAQNELGMLYQRQGNDIKAQRWWSIAANADDEYAQFNLASLFLQQKKIKKAYYWFKQANENQHPQAQMALNELKKMEVE
ncbi:MAG: sel1 repeat family protein [Candidatus Thioglobus sp.]|nr:MAG: sel1 repeat family protein [Candidatus Thioglobus sp.]